MSVARNASGCACLKLHNVRALQRDYRAVGDALWGRFNPEAGRDGTLGYYRGLVMAYAQRVQQVGDSRFRHGIRSLHDRLQHERVP